jgi:lysozyme family protein
MRTKFLLIFLTLFTFSATAGNFDKFFYNVLKVEGREFVNTAFDRGGATKLGITLKSFIAFCSMPIVPIKCDKNNDSRLTARDVFYLTPSDVLPIYKLNYWNVVQADSIKNQAIAEFLADFVVNSGGRKSNIQALQRIIGSYPDGRFGVKTVAKINGQNAKRLFNKLYNFRLSFYKKIVSRNPSQRKFLKGWKNRIFKLKSIYQNEKLI